MTRTLKPLGPFWSPCRSIRTAVQYTDTQYLLPAGGQTPQQIDIWRCPLSISGTHSDPAMHSMQNEAGDMRVMWLRQKALDTDSDRV